VSADPVATTPARKSDFTEEIRTATEGLARGPVVRPEPPEPEEVQGGLCQRAKRLERWTDVDGLEKTPQKDTRWDNPVEGPGNRIFGVLTILQHLLDDVTPQSRWPGRLSDLHRDYPDVPRSQMGYPDSWTNRPTWSKRAATAWADLISSIPFRRPDKMVTIRDETAPVCLDAKGAPGPDPELRGAENVPLSEDMHEYMAREVLPCVSNAWVNEAVRDPQDGGLGKAGYEIDFNRYFYVYVPPRPLAEIEADIRELETEIVRMLGEITGSGAEQAP
jgi:hypothetical protein